MQARREPDVSRQCAIVDDGLARPNVQRRDAAHRGVEHHFFDHVKHQRLGFAQGQHRHLEAAARPGLARVEDELVGHLDHEAGGVLQALCARLQLAIWQLDLLVAQLDHLGAGASHQQAVDVFIALGVKALRPDLAFAAQPPRAQWCKARAHAGIDVNLVALILSDPLDAGLTVDGASVKAFHDVAHARGQGPDKALRCLPRGRCHRGCG